MTRPTPAIPPINDLHPESIRFLAKLFHGIYVEAEDPHLEVWSSEIVVALEHALNCDGDGYAAGAHVPPLSDLPDGILERLPRVVAWACRVANDFEIGLDGDGAAWLAALMAFVDHEAECRAVMPRLPLTPADRMVHDALDAAMRAAENARERQSRLTPDVSGIPPWSSVSGAPE